MAARHVMGPKWGPDPSRRSEKARRAILDATLDLIVIGGWEGLTIEGIAARAGVGKQTIYRWWPTKGAVVFDAFLGDMKIGGKVTFPDTGELAQDLRIILRETVDEFSDPGFDGVMRALLAEAQNDTALADDLRRRILIPQTAATIVRIESAKVAGQADPEADGAVLAEMLFGPLLRRWLLGTGEVDYGFADETAALVTRAAAPRSGDDQSS